MTCEQAWTLFFATGLPEAYSLFGQMRDGGRTECAIARGVENAPEEKTA